MTLHCFNPDHDLALANGGPHYTATPHAEALRRDLQLLPAWLAEPGDTVLCDRCDRATTAWLERQGLAVGALARNDLRHLPAGTRISPWGWNAAMRWRLMHWGVAEQLLPSGDDVARWRALAHRRISITIHRHITAALGQELCPAPVECRTMAEVLDFARRHPGAYVKEPWSGSGRGVLRALPPIERDFMPRAAGALRRQGSLLCEQPLDRVADCAAEMHCRDGHATVTGYSVFSSDFHSQYAGGMVAGRDALRQRLTAIYPAFDVVEHALISAIDTLVAPHYSGPLGVDMLLYRRGNGTIGIDPCVELNLRCTMGHITAALGERHRRAGRFAIKPIEAMTHGDRPLTPVDAGTRWVAVLTDCGAT